MWGFEVSPPHPPPPGRDVANFGWIIGIDILGFEMSPPTNVCLVFTWGLKCLPPFMDIELDWGSKCLPSFVDVWLFSGFGISFHTSYPMVVVNVLSINSSYVIVKYSGGSLVFIVQLFITSSIWVPATIKALKLGKYCANKYLWYTSNKFFITMANYFSSLGLLIICAALALHLIMKVEKDSFSSCLVVSRSLLVMSTSILYLYCL